MKGLNFSAVAPDATSADVAGRIGGTSESEGNAEDETEEDDEKDGEGEDEDEEDGQDEDESGSDQTDDKGRHAVTGKTEADVPQPSKKNAPPAMASTAKTVRSVRTAQDEQSSSGTVSSPHIALCVLL